MRILALDLATRTGWACGSPELGVIEHGSFKIPSQGEELGTFLQGFSKFLHSAIARTSPNEIVFEAPVMRGLGKTSLITLRKLYSLAGVTELVALERAVPVTEALLPDIRAHALGKGNTPRKRPDVKRAILAWCKSKGWSPYDDNDADALALLSYRLSHFDPAVALRATPLFGDAA